MFSSPQQTKVELGLDLLI